MKYKIQITIDSEVQDPIEVLDFFNETVFDLVPEYLEGRLIEDETTVERLEELPTSEQILTAAIESFSHLDDETFTDIFITAHPSDWIESSGKVKRQYIRDSYIRLTTDDGAKLTLSRRKMDNAIKEMATVETGLNDRIQDCIKEALIERHNDDEDEICIANWDWQVCDAVVQWTLFGEIVYG